MNQTPKVMIVGGPDVDARLDLMNRLNHSFQFAAAGSDASLREKFAEQGFEFHHFGMSRNVSPAGDCVTCYQLMRVFRRYRPDIVHCFDTKPGIWGCLAARLAGVPRIVGTVTGLGSLFVGSSLKARVAWNICRRLHGFACRASDLTIFQNRDDLNYFIENKLTSAEKAELILGSGVATDEFSPNRITKNQRNEFRKQLGIGDDELVVTMVSRVMRSKGVTEFVEASRRLTAAYPNVRFLLIGGADDESVDRFSADELADIHDSVIWPGSHNDIPTVLASSDIFALPTAYPEGLPRALLEAASMGLPLISTRAPGCNEIVEDGVNGFRVAVGDADALAESVIDLARDRDKVRRFGRASRQMAVERFDIRVIADQTKAIYEGLLDCDVTCATSIDS